MFKSLHLRRQLLHFGGGGGLGYVKETVLPTMPYNVDELRIHSSAVLPPDRIFVLIH